MFVFLSVMKGVLFKGEPSSAAATFAKGVPVEETARKPLAPG